MNKLLLVGENNKLDAGTYFLDQKNNASCAISHDVFIYNYTKTCPDLTFNMQDKASLNLTEVYYLNNDTTLNINLKNNNTFNLILIIINHGANTLNINLNLTANASKSNILVRAINENKESSLHVICNGSIKAKTTDNEILEDIKGLIINDDTIKISPNLKVDTNEVLANHLVTIGSFNKDELFYLMGKGITLKTAKKMLIASFILSNLPEELKKFIKLEVINIE